MLSLKSCEVAESGAINATYDANEPGNGKGAAPISVGAVRLESDSAGARAVLELDPVDAATEEEAFDALADSLERVAKAIRDRGEPTRGVPLYGT